MTLNESNPHWKLVQRYADGITSAKEVTALEETLADDPEFRKAFLTYLSLDAALEDTLQQTGLPPRAAIKRLTLMPVFGLIGVMCLIAISVYLLKGNISAQTVVAQIGETSNDLRWLSNSFSKGSDLKEGTRLELASGDVEIRFTSGALTRLHGPALFEIVSNNS